MTTAAVQRRLTPAEVAEILGVDVGKVLKFIAAKELRAIDVSQKQEGKPRWRITPADLELFEARRANTLGAMPEVERPRKSKRPEGWVEYV